MQDWIVDKVMRANINKSMLHDQAFFFIDEAVPLACALPEGDMRRRGREEAQPGLSKA
jgi:hypothetical protein